MNFILRFSEDRKSIHPLRNAQHSFNDQKIESSDSLHTEQV